MLGGALDPLATESEAFDIYCDEIAMGDLLNKSPNQKRAWKKTKQRTINYFVEAVGIRDIPLVGVSLAALRKAPDGFPRYRDKNEKLAALLHAFPERTDPLPCADQWPGA